MTKRDYPECVSLLLTTLYLAVYCWVSLCGLQSMGSVLRVHTSRWVLECGTEGSCRYRVSLLVFLGDFSTVPRARKST